MKTMLILTILLTNSLWAHSQLSEDSLKQICINQFKDEFVNIDTSSFKNYYMWRIVGEEVKELFTGYFKDIRIFEVSGVRRYEIAGARNWSVRIYALNTFTGQNVKIPDYKLFNNVMDAATKRIINLDRCYFYILFNSLEECCLTSPDLYMKIIGSKSIFLNTTENFCMRPFGTYHGEVYRTDTLFDAMYLDLRSSSITFKNIRVYVEYKGHKDSGQGINVYNFKFLGDGELIKVTKQKFNVRSARY